VPQFPDQFRDGPSPSGWRVSHEHAQHLRDLGHVVLDCPRLTKGFGRAVLARTGDLRLVQAAMNHARRS